MSTKSCIDNVLTFMSHAVPFTPSQGVLSPTPSNMAALWYQHQQAYMAESPSYHQHYPGTPLYSVPVRPAAWPTVSIPNPILQPLINLNATYDFVDKMSDAIATPFGTSLRSHLEDMRLLSFIDAPRESVPRPDMNLHTNAIACLFSGRSCRGLSAWGRCSHGRKPCTRRLPRRCMPSPTPT